MVCGCGLRDVVLQVLGNFAEWLMPLHELPKTADLVKAKLRDIAEHSEELFLKMEECLGLS